MIWWLRYGAGFALLCLWDVTDWHWPYAAAWRLFPADVFGTGADCSGGSGEAPF